MALQDLTPQLRTRLSRVERAVGVFVLLATLLLLAGFCYYLYHTASRRGWFVTKVTYYTLISSSAGLKEGDPVKLLGREAGEITKITPMPPEETNSPVYVEFTIRDPYFGYLWTHGSVAKITATDFLGNRYIEVTKGDKGSPTFRQEKVTNWFFGQRVKNVVTGVWHDQDGKFVPITTGSKYWLLADESPALTERLVEVAQKVEAALPGILNLTNQLTEVITNSVRTIVHLDTLIGDIRPSVGDARELIAGLRPAVSNLTLISAQLRDPKGSFGEWLLPTNLHAQLEQTLASANAALHSANTTVTNADEKLALVVSNLNLSLENLSQMTSNLNVQVQANTNILSEISSGVAHADQLVQGLKKHWLFRSAFRTNTPPPASRSTTPPKRK